LLGFDKDPTAPKAYQKHHVDDQEGRRMWDLNIYSITQYFKLCLENNPNMVDTLYTPRDCVLHSTTISEMVRDKRDLFLHKKCWPKYKGYAYQQLHKMRSKEAEEGSKRWLLRQRHGYDVKFAYHLIRLLLEAEMIMTEGTIDIRRHKEHLKAIRRGEVSQQDVEKWAAEKEAHLERAFENSKLRAEPARDEIKQLLLNCLEHHYGSLEVLSCVRQACTEAEKTLNEIRSLLGV
jgi:predicted nucleotidyltransferase